MTNLLLEATAALAAATGSEALKRLVRKPQIEVLITDIRDGWV
jgi:hypothetical protein